MTQTATRPDLTTGPFLKKIILFALPLALSSVLQLFFNAADIVVVGRFAGSEALAAVGSNGSLTNLLTNLFIGLSVGANVVAARGLGAGDREGVHNTVHTAVLLSLLCGAVLAVAGFFSARTLLGWMSSPEDVIDLATLYLKIYFIGMPVTMLYNFGSALLRAAGDTRRPLYCLAVAGLINIVLNLVFVIVFHMSVAGVALATIISQAVSAVMVLVILMNETGLLHLELSELRLHRSAMLKIMQIGLPAGLQGTIFSLSNVVIQSAINSFGSVVIAGNSAASNIEGFVYVAMNALHQACVTFTSQNMGAGKYNNIGKVLRGCQICVVVAGLSLSLGAVLCSDVLVGVYSADPAVIAAGRQRLELICMTYVLCGVMDTMVGSLRGMGFSIMPMIVSLLGSCVFRLVWVATIFRVNPTIITLYLCYPISWLITAAAHVVCYFIVRRKFIPAQRVKAKA